MPSLKAFQSRKIFYSHHKKRYDTGEEWLCCVIDTLQSCEYGKLSEFLLIDKLIAGLNDESEDDICEKLHYTQR